MHYPLVPPASALPQVEPPELLRLVGHPLRWRLLTELTASDRTVLELTERVGGAQNLVSYHLAKLRSAGLVHTRRSSADRRDAFYTADLVRLGDELRATTAALHPGLAGGPPSTAAQPPAAGTVLFLCTGNSARSQMAEALIVHRSRGAVQACSAGSRPKPLHPLAVDVMREEYGIDISGRESKHLDRFADQSFDRVITLCDKVREVCPERPGTEPVHWSLPDPASDPSDDAGAPAFRRTAAELDVRIGFLLAALAHPAPPPTH